VRVDFTRKRMIENKTMRVKSSRMRVVKKTKKAKHGVSACRSKVYVYYDEFKVIFLMLLVGLELRISGLHVLRLMHHACEFKIYSFFKHPQLCACNLGLCLYRNKVVQHATCENHTHECENHTRACQNHTRA
jgi:hypothetical protein